MMSAKEEKKEKENIAVEVEEFTLKASKSMKA